jgi:hypothetical protein
MESEHPFLELAREMGINESEQEWRLGRAISHAMQRYELPTGTTGMLLNALAEIASTKERALFCDEVVASYMSLYIDKEEALVSLRRLARFLSACSTLEEYEQIVTQKLRK